MRQLRHTSRLSLRLHLVFGLAMAGALVVGGGTWAAYAELEGAVVASGQVTVKSNVKAVQHPTGGVVADLLVHDGDYVTAGQVLVRLDDTTAKANLATETRGIVQMQARAARLEAESVGAESIAFPQELVAVTDPDVQAQTAGEVKLFELRRNAREGQKAQLQATIDQLNQQISGDGLQMDARQKQIDLDNSDLAGLRPLLAKGLVQTQRVTDLERALASLQGEFAAYASDSASAKEKISQTELQIAQVDQDARSSVASDLRDTQYQIMQLDEKRIAAEDDLQKKVIRAPQDGRINHLTVHTIGGVIGAGDTIMEVVPVDDQLTVDFKISPDDIPQVLAGESAYLRFSAFDQRSTPEVMGTVTMVSAEITVDQRTGASYYTGIITPDPGELATLGDLKITPGMPVEIFVRTGARTAANYFLKPLMDQMDRAFRTK